MPRRRAGRNEYNRAGRNEYKRIRWLKKVAGVIADIGLLGLLRCPGL